MAKATTVTEYLNQLPDDRRAALEAIRKTIKKNIDKTFKEGIVYGMVGYYVPHSVYPEGYHCDPKTPLHFASIASQKNHIGLYFFCVYVDPELQKWFVDAWKKSGKRLDMGKSCVRVKKLEDIPMDVVAELFKRATAKKFIAAYDKIRPASAKKKGAKKKVAAKKKATVKKKSSAKKKSAAKKTAKKKSAKKS